MDTILVDISQHFIYGIITGSMYVLMAVGFSLIWGILDMLNFSHGEFFMLGGYLTYYLFTFLNMNPFIAVFLSMVILLIFGSIIFGIVVFPMIKKPNWIMNGIILTLGISICLQNGALLTFGETYKGMPQFFDTSLRFFGVVIGLDRLMVLLIGLVLITCLLFFVTKTDTGLCMQAVSQDKDSALLMGINIRRIYVITFGVSAALAGAAGGLLAPIYFVYPSVGFTPMLMAFAVVILGGLGSVKGAIFAGFLVGIIENFTIFLLSSAWKDVVIFSIIIVILLIRPRGLFGVKDL